MTEWPNADRFAALPPERAERWQNFADWDEVYLPSYLGMKVEELRTDYARISLPFRQELTQPAGVLHGGATAALIDTVVVPPIGSGYDEPMGFTTIAMNINYVGPAGSDIVAEGWVERRGRSIVFCRAEVWAHDGAPIANASVIYKVLGPMASR